MVAHLRGMGEEEPGTVINRSFVKTAAANGLRGGHGDI